MGKLKCILIACLVLCLIGLVSISIFSKEAKEVTLENKQDKELASDTGINVDDQIERYVGTSESETTEHEVTYNNRKVGFLTIDDSAVNYPVMQSDDLVYYTQHNSSGKIDSKGAIFLDSRIAADDARVYLLHGLVNEEGSMFSELSNYLEESYAMEHQSCKFTVDEDVNVFDLFAVVTMEADEPVIDLECDSDSKVERQFNLLKGLSLYEFDKTYTENSKLLILNTMKGNTHILVCYLQNNG